MVLHWVPDHYPDPLVALVLFGGILPTPHEEVSCQNVQRKVALSVAKIHQNIYIVCHGQTNNIEQKLKELFIGVFDGQPHKKAERQRMEKFLVI